MVKEEKRLRVDNSPYGKFLENVKKNLFDKHPYKLATIGEMDHLDAASLEEFLAFNKKYYVPNNAVLVVAGDIDVPTTKKMIADYFGEIPRGADVPRVNIKENPIEQPIKAVAYDPNIQIPAVVTGYRMPALTTREAKVLDMISTYLSDGNSSKLYKKMVDEQKMALQVGAFNISQEDYGMYLIFGLPLGENSLESLVEAMDEEVVKIQNELISPKISKNCKINLKQIL